MLLLLGGFLVLMLLGVPVAIAMAASSLLYILVSGVTPDVTLASRVFRCSPCRSSSWPAIS
jgi:hypothetical protein